MAGDSPRSHRGRSPHASSPRTSSPSLPKAQNPSNRRNRRDPAESVPPERPQTSVDGANGQTSQIPKSCLGILNDRETEEVPGTVLLLVGRRNEPLGLEPQQAGRTDSSMPPQPLSPRPRGSSAGSFKRTRDGHIILNPQPDDSANDPLNWPAWRRDCALLSLGFYCMLGGGMTPVLAAGFEDVADTYHVSYSEVALTTGLYMMGLGVGSVIFSPTAILFGKRPTYLFSAAMFIATSCWCAVAPSYSQLVVARIFQGIAVSPVECLPSATIAEIFFLHERAFRVGIYTLLLLGGKNLVPLVSAAIIGAKGWRWVFWVVAMIVGGGAVLLFLFVPETFWDRTPRPRLRRLSSASHLSHLIHKKSHHFDEEKLDELEDEAVIRHMTPRQHRLHESNVHARFEHVPPEDVDPISENAPDIQTTQLPKRDQESARTDTQVSGPSTANREYDRPGAIEKEPAFENTQPVFRTGEDTSGLGKSLPARKRPKPTSIEMPPPPVFRMNSTPWDGTIDGKVRRASVSDLLASAGGHTFHPDGSALPNSAGADVDLPHLHNLNSPFYVELEKNIDYLDVHDSEKNFAPKNTSPKPHLTFNDTRATSKEGRPNSPTSPKELEKTPSVSNPIPSPKVTLYTSYLRQQPPQSFAQTLKPWNGRLSHSNWFLVALRPFILFAYPSVLWSAMVYALSVGWLIVLSEAVAHIYRDRESYNFSALGTGLVYVSPFVGGILGTAVAGKVSDVIVRFMARKNGGVYEPEFRLVMALPIAICTAVGLMGFGWSAEERDSWIVPTTFFGIISFGCCLGSTTSITFCVDSYRQYAGEALVTLNFSKNILHGLVFSLFFPSWLESQGPKNTFLTIGGIQIACMLLSVPMYIYGKRSRMWTVRMGFLERF